MRSYFKYLQTRKQIWDAFCNRHPVISFFIRAVIVVASELYICKYFQIYPADSTIPEAAMSFLVAAFQIWVGVMAYPILPTLGRALYHGSSRLVPVKLIRTITSIGRDKR